MLKVLVGKQFMEIFRSYFYDAKKNKARSKGTIIFYIVLYAIVMIGIMGGMFGFLAYILCSSIVSIGADWLYFDIMGLMAVALGAFGSVFSTYSSLYLAKDNDLLLSLPIKIDVIIASRLLTVYLMGLMYSAIVIVPAVIVYWLTIKQLTFMIVFANILTIFIISLIVMLLSCLLGYVVAKISQKLHNKSFATAAVSLLFIGGYYYFYFKAEGMISYFLENVVYYGDKIKNSAYPLYIFGLSSIGDLKSLAIVISVMAILCFLTWKMMSKGFLSIATNSSNEKKRKFTGNKEKKKSVFVALLSKEFARFTGSANYMLNCGLSTLFIPAGAIALLIKKESLFENIGLLFNGETEAIAIIACGLTIALISMNNSAVCSVSLEGKNIWLVKSLPVKATDVLKAKLSVQLILTLPPIWFLTACLLMVFPQDFVIGLLIILFNTTVTLLYALFCLFLGIKMANLDWTSEIMVIKQSWSVMIALFSSWILSAAFVIIYINLSEFSSVLYLIIWLIPLMICCLIIGLWLNKKGTVAFEEL